MPSATVKDIKDIPEVMTVEEMRQFLGISRPTAYELVNQATFPTIRIGRAIRVRKSSLLLWLDQQARGEITT